MVGVLSVSRKRRRIMPKTVVLQEFLRFDGVAAERKREKLPAGYVAEIRMGIRYTVTDAGIAAGETVDGVVDEFKIVDGKRTIIEARRDELNRIATMSCQGTDTGKQNDPLPTTAVEATSRFTFRGPFWFGPNTLADFARRAATDEWGGATAFVGFVEFEIDYFTVDEIRSLKQANGGDLIAIRFLRAEAASASRPELQVEAGRIVQLYLVMETADRLDELHLPNGFKFIDEVSLHTNFATYKDEAPAATLSEFMLWPDLQARPNDRLTVVTAGGNSAAKLFYAMAEVIS